MTAVERTVILATLVDDLTAAWQFVFDHLDEVGPDPKVQINPIWSVSADDRDDPMVRRFEVSVSGMQERGER